MQRCAGRSSGVAGVPCCARYAGAAHRTRRLGHRRRATSDESCNSAMRTATSKPSARRSTKRSSRTRSTSTSGWRARNALTSGPRWRWPKLMGALTRTRPGAALALGLLEVGEDALGALVEALARIRQPDLPGGAVEEADPEPILQRAHLLADRRHRQPERPRRAGEAARRHHALECRDA